MSEQRFESVREAAARLGVSARTVRWYCLNAKIPCSKVGDSWIIPVGATPTIDTSKSYRRNVA